MKKSLKFLGVLLCSITGALLLTMCSGSAKKGESATSSSSSDGQTKTITFWHLDTTEEQQAAWRTIADRFEAKHPGVKIEITVIANDGFKQKLSTVMQSGWSPDVFRSWGAAGEKVNKTSTAIRISHFPTGIVV